MNLKIKVFKSSKCKICVSKEMDKIVDILADNQDLEEFDVNTPKGLSELAFESLTEAQLPIILIREE